MIFIHDDPEFGDLLLIVADKIGFNPAMVEKDYWVTHCLWALLDQGFDLWLKGGTSLSKGFDLINRFSEDLDLKLESGAVAGIPAVQSWKSKNTSRTAERRDHFHSLCEAIEIPGTKLVAQFDAMEENRCRDLSIHVRYPLRFRERLHTQLQPFVLLEVGNAKVVPAVRCDLSSWVHEHVHDASPSAEYKANLPKRVRCLHPLVTLVEKLEVICRRYDKKSKPATFIRHYEDAARIIERADKLPNLERDVGEVVAEMLDAGDLRTALPSPAHPAFQTTNESEQQEALRLEFASLDPLYWGDRMSLEDCCERIRRWLQKR